MNDGQNTRDHGRSKPDSAEVAEVDDVAESSVYLAATQALRDADGDRERAIGLLRERIDSDPALRKALLEPLILIAVRQEILHASRIMNQPKGASPRIGKDSADGIASVAHRTWMEYVLPSGIQLRNATKADLIEAATFHDQQAKGNGRKATWLKSLARRLNATSAVRNAMSEDEIAKQWEASAHA